MSQFFVKFNKIDKSLATLTKENIETTQITVSEMIWGMIIDAVDFKRIVREYFKELCLQNVTTSTKWTNYLRNTNKQPPWQEIDKWNIPVTIEEI